MELGLLSLTATDIPVSQGHGILGSGDGFRVRLRGRRRRRSFFPDGLLSLYVGGLLREKYKSILL